MTERWRRPVTLVGIESSEDTMRIGDREYRDYEYVMKREDWERIRLGYVCIQCFEPHEQPFPPACPVCGLTAQMQHDRIPMEYDGTVDLDPRYEQEEARIAEENERRMRQPGSRIVVPNALYPMKEM